MRSKEFHNFSYKNLGDIGAEDHITAIKQLAERYSYMDLSKVGIYGHSAGGYDAAHALLTHPEFYKVAVSSAGNHDHRMAKVWWPELWMGFPVGKHYEEQSNLSLAKNLEGKLLLVHGDMDNNINPASTLRFTAELIKANKDFDLIIIPNKKHGLGDHSYFIRKRWDYFVQHLLGVIAPKEYKIGDISIL
jgi:dipeptidyl aminopeptidase/acylaminoacyl peptidase